MFPERLPITKLLDTPFISLDETNVEMASILFLFIIVVVISQVRRQRQLVRHLVQTISIVVFFYFVYSCLGVFGMIRNGLYGLTLVGTAYTESFYWMALPISVIATCVIAGPVFCSWICPTGTIQEAAAWVRRRVVRGRDRASPLQLALLGGLGLLFLSGVIWLSVRQQLFIEDSSLHWGGTLLVLCYLVLLGILDDIPSRRLRVVSLIAIFVTAVSHLTITSPVHFAFTARDDPASATTTVVIAVASLFVMRSWCRYLCPWGVLMGFFNRFSRIQLRINASQCTACRVCTSVCDIAAVDEGGVRAAHCQLCYACVDHCPEQAIEVVDVWQEGAAVVDRDAAPGDVGARG